MMLIFPINPEGIIIGENFLVTLALFSGETINFSATIRSKDKAVRDIIHRQLQAQNLQELA